MEKSFWIKRSNRCISLAESWRDDGEFVHDPDGRRPRRIFSASRHFHRNVHLSGKHRRRYRARRNRIRRRIRRPRRPASRRHRQSLQPKIPSLSNSSLADDWIPLLSKKNAINKIPLAHSYFDNSSNVSSEPCHNIKRGK